MKIKTQDLTGPALDLAVAKCIWPEVGNTVPFHRDGSDYSPSTNWAHGGPIIEREKIDLHHHRHGDLSVGWDATIDSWDSEHSGPTPLIAAMRCYVASRLGDTVEIPEELK